MLDAPAGKGLEGKRGQAKQSEATQRDGLLLVHLADIRKKQWPTGSC